jgi:hypothetical protein
VFHEKMGLLLHLIIWIRPLPLGALFKHTNGSAESSTFKIFNIIGRKAANHIRVCLTLELDGTLMRIGLRKPMWSLTSCVSVGDSSISFRTFIESAI